MPGQHAGRTSNFSANMLNFDVPVFNRETHLGHSISQAPLNIFAYGFAGYVGMAAYNTLQISDSLKEKTIFLIPALLAGHAIRTLTKYKRSLDAQRMSTITSMDRAIRYLNGHDGDWNGRDHLSETQQVFLKGVLGESDPHFRGQVIRRIQEEQRKLAGHIGWLPKSKTRAAALNALKPA